MKDLVLEQINDSNLQEHLRGEITLRQLQERMNGIEPFIVENGKLRVKTQEERKQEFEKNLPTSEAVILGTNGMVRSSAVKNLQKLLLEHRCVSSAHLTSDQYRNRMNRAKNFVTWGVKYTHETYTGNGKRNVLFMENALLKQTSGLYVDNGGYFGHSSIRTSGEYHRSASLLEKKELDEFCRRHFGVSAGKYSGDRNGFILVALQTYKDAPVRYYTPARDSVNNPDPVKWLLEQCYRFLPSDIPAVIRPHPGDYNDFLKHDYSDLLREGWEISLEHDLHRNVLPSCRGVVTLNSTVAVDALVHGLPVAALGQSVWTGSPAVLDCSEKTAVLGKFSTWTPPADAVINTLAAIWRHQLPYNATYEQVRNNRSVQEFIKAIKPLTAMYGTVQGCDEEYINAAEAVRNSGDETWIMLLEQTEERLANCTGCEKNRLKGRIINIAKMLADGSIE